MTKLHRLKKQRGFTLLELIAVLTILAILMAALTPAINRQIKNSRIRSTKVIMNGLEQALSSFSLDCGYYPTTEQGLEALLTQPSVGKTCKNYSQDGYFDKKRIPQDPWSNPFKYISPGQANPSGYDLFSFGPDRQEGTEDDIKSWED